MRVSDRRLSQGEKEQEIVKRLVSSPHRNEVNVLVAAEQKRRTGVRQDRTAESRRFEVPLFIHARH